MTLLGIEALYRRPNASKPAPGHQLSRYLLCKVPMTRTNRVWVMVSTEIPTARGVADLTAVADPLQPQGSRSAALRPPWTPPSDEAVAEAPARSSPRSCARRASCW